tara:strand:+ start:11679 stop:14984 length:3306 start_codon:yes stop_codon:yes gene_type:complete
MNTKNKLFHFGLAPLVLAMGTIPFQAMGAEAPTLQASAVAQISALKQIKNARNSVQQKIQPELFLGLLHSAAQASGRSNAQLAALPEYRFITDGADGRTEVEVVLVQNGDTTAVLHKINALGGVINIKPQKGDLIVTARVPLAQLEALAESKHVMSIRRAMPPVTHAINRSEGIETHGAATASATFGATGAGVKICVMSDGIDSLSAAQTSGDLPFVDVLPGQAGNGDEGTAMLEIVHDMAPDADLGYATAFNGIASFAQNILDLADDGCDIIVDDIIYFAESPFQDALIAQAVNTVTANGVLYFSSAGNEGNLNDGTSGTWEGDFNANGTLPSLGADLVHNFGDGGQSVLVTGNGSRVVLTWAEHATNTQGFASTDYDLYVMNGSLTSVLDSSTDTQNGSGGNDFPFEFIGNGADTGERIVVTRAAAGTTSSPPMFNLINFRGRIDSAVATSGATRGHSAAVNAFSTAAAPVRGPFPAEFTGSSVSETFTSDGPRRIILSPTGTELCPGNRTSSCANGLRLKPDITAADGVATSAPGFNPFFGTSAAAPHAAAIAGLLKSADPGLTASEIRNALINTAIDIEIPGNDRDTGVGIVMPGPALAAIGATPQPNIRLNGFFLDQLAGDGDADVEPGEQWALTVPFQNVGSATASSVIGRLSTGTIGVNISTPASGYANIAAGNTRNNNRQYVFEVLESAVCGAPIDFNVEARHNGNLSPQNFAVSQPVGSDGAPQVFTYAGPVVPIPDAGAAIAVDLPVSGISGNISDVDLIIEGSACTSSAGATTVGIDHTFVGDLQIGLNSPDGTSGIVIDRVGTSGNNFCQTTLDDDGTDGAIQSQSSAAAPFTGSFTANIPLSGFNGENPNGTWQLTAQDFAGIDTGNVRSFSLQFSQVVCDAIAPDTTPDAYDFIDRTDRPTAARISSNEVTITGLTAAAPISISAPGISEMMSINGGPLIAGPSTVNNGDTVRISVLSPGAANTSRTVDVDIGGVLESWNVTTGSVDETPAPFDFVDVADVVPGRTLFSNTVTLTGFNAPTSIEIRGASSALYSINGKAFTQAIGTINPGDNVRIRMKAGSAAGAVRRAVLIVGRIRGDWRLTTATP